MTRRFLFALFAAASVASLVVAADWPTFRGPKRDNVSPDKGLLEEWPKDGPELVWKGTGLGQGFSSVSVVGDRVFTMGNKDGKAYVFAIDRKKGGKPLWEAEVGAADKPDRPGTRCTPTVDGGLVYGLSSTGDLVCVEAAGGKLKWKKSFTGKDYKGSVGGWKYSESPLIDGDRLVCTPGGKVATLLVLDKKTGEEILKAPLELGNQQAGYSSVVISNGGGVKQYVTLTQAGTIGVEAATGKLLWHYKKYMNNTANVPTPIVLGDQILTATGYGKGTALLSLSKDGDKVKMQEEWHEGGLSNLHGGLVVLGDYVYGDKGGGGELVCVEWKTGKIKWSRNQSKKRGKGGSSASITYADGNLYVHYQNGIMSLVPASPAGYQEKGSFEIPDKDRESWAHPVVIDGRLYVREQNNLYCYDVKAK